MNFSYKDGDGWRFLTHLFEARYIETWRIRTGIHADDNERNALVLCAFQIAAPHIKSYFVEIAAALILPWVDRIEWRDIFDFIIKMFNNSVDVKWRPDGYSILLRKLWWDWKRQINTVLRKRLPRRLRCIIHGLSLIGGILYYKFQRTLKAS